MGNGRGMHDGILRDDGFKARMMAVAARNRRLGMDFTRRAEVRRGAGPGAGASGRSEYRRRVVVKAKYHDRAKAGRPNMVAALLNYLEKEGPLMDKHGERADREAMAREMAHDRRIFHVIVSPNDGHRFTDAELVSGPGSVGAEIARRWERRAGPLEIVMSVEAKTDAAHPDGNKHIHFAVRGVQDGRDLYLRRELISQRFREDAEDVVTDRLGYMGERERRELEARLERNARERGRDRERDLVRERTQDRDRDDGRGVGLD